MNKALLERLQVRIMEVTSNVVRLREYRHLKDDTSFVTQGDLLLNKVIIEEVRASYPAIEVVSEEGDVRHVDGLAHHIVVIDPIDGTENFTSGLPEWGVSISFFENGAHRASLIGCPEMGLWLKTGEKFRRFSSRIRGLSSSMQKDDLIKATEGYEYRILGCCVYNMINVVRGSFLTFENPKGAHNWDILGGLNLALEHNLKVTVDEKPYQGEYLRADRKYRFRVEN